MEVNIAIFLGCLLPGLYIVYTDIKWGVIKDYITFLIFMAGLIYALITKTYVNALIGSSLGFITFFIVAWITNGALGGGDIKFSAGIGMWFGYPDVATILILATILAIIYELFRYIHQGKLHELFHERLFPYFQKVFLRYGYKVKSIDLSINKKYKPIPFGPFLVISTWIIWGLGFL